MEPDVQSDYEAEGDRYEMVVAYYEAEGAAEPEGWELEQGAEIEAEYAWLRYSEDQPPDVGDEHERELMQNDPWFSMTDEEKTAAWEAYHKAMEGRA